MLLDVSQSQLVLIDYQTALMPVIFDRVAVITNAARLGRMAALLEVPAWATEQNLSSADALPGQGRPVDEAASGGDGRVEIGRRGGNAHG